MVMTGIVSGCVSSPTSAPVAQTGGVDPLVMTDDKGRLIKDDIARYAVSVPPGSSSSILLTDNRRIFVRVGADYIAATGENCRRLTLEVAPGKSTLSAICFVNNVWQTALWP